MKIWIEKVWGSRSGGLLKKSLLVWDSFSGHLVDSVKDILSKEHATSLAVIPGGLTSVIQPLDVCLNKPFKDRLREKWSLWMLEGEKSFTPAGNMRAAPLDIICKWVLDSWNDWDVEMIQDSFKKCGISNALDGTEDDILWDDKEVEADNNDEEEHAEHNVYDTEITAEQMVDLFGDTDAEDEEFDGFNEVEDSDDDM